MIDGVVAVLHFRGRNLIVTLLFVEDLFCLATTCRRGKMSLDCLFNNFNSVTHILNKA